MMTRPPAALLILALTLAAASAHAQMQLRHETTEPGRVVMVGNTLGLSANSAHDGPGTVGSIGVFTTVDDTLQVSGWPAGTTTQWRDNSSSARLAFDEYGTVRHAELVWSGSWDYPEGVLAPNELDSPVSFQTPAGVFSVSPDPATTRTISQQALPPATFRVRYYVRSADVTELVRDAGPGEYIVSGVAGTIGAAGNELNAAGWTLVVVLADADEPTRNMTVYVGGEWVDEASALDTTVGGFCTPPSGPVLARLALSAVEGDAHFTGDQFLIQSPTSATFLPLAGPNNPVDNFFGSQINGRDGTLVTTGTFGNANHNAVAGANIPGARQGWDITTITLSSAQGHLQNAQTSTTVRGTSSSDGSNDSYVLNALAMEIDVNAPAFGFADNTLVDIVPGNTATPPRSDSQISVGDTLQFLYEIRNDGSADADSVTFVASLPDTLALVPGSFEVDGTPHPDVTAASLADGIPLGPVPRIEDGEGLLVFFEATVLAISAPPLSPDIIVQPYWDYTWRSCPSSPEIQARTVAAASRFGAAQLVLEKSATPTGTLEPGDVITWTLVVTNAGTRTSRFAALLDDAPTGTTYVPGSTTLNGLPVPDANGQMPFAEWGTLQAEGRDPGALEPGDSAVVTFQSTIREDFEGTIRNSASARESDVPDAGGVDAEIEIVVVQPDTGDSDSDSDSDSGADSDSDADSDSGSDSDADSDSDSDSDSDADADGGADADGDADAGNGDSDSDADGDAGEPTDGDTGTTTGDDAESTSDAADAGDADRGDRDLPSRPPGEPAPDPSGEVGTASGCCSVASGAQQRSATVGAVLVMLGLLRLRRREIAPA